MSKGRAAKVYHAELWGLREKKYEWLLGHDVETTKWTELSPKSEFYLFVPRDEAAIDALYPKVEEELLGINVES